MDRGTRGGGVGRSLFLVVSGRYASDLARGRERRGEGAGWKRGVRGGVGRGGGGGGGGERVREQWENGAGERARRQRDS